MLNEIKEILINRGINPEEIEPYKTEELPEYRFVNTDVAIKQFSSQVMNFKQIGILYDVDVDGLYAGEMMLEYLRFLQIHPWYMMNSGKSHGLNDCVVDWVEKNRIEYLIVVDAGTHDSKYFKKLNDQGIKVLVLDHHDVLNNELLEKYSDEETTVVVNSNYEGSPNRTISGTGVVYRFIREVDKLFKATNTDKYKSWVGLTVLSDSCFILDRENRHYVKYLYDNYTKDALFNSFTNYGSSETMFNFTIIPLLNSCIRMGRQDLAIDLVSHKNPSTIKKLVEDANEVRKLQKGLVEKSLDVIKKIEGKNTIVCTLDTDEYGGIIGLIANKIKNNYEKAAIVLTKSTLKEISSEITEEVHSSNIEGTTGLTVEKELENSINTKEDPDTIIYKGSFRGTDGITTDTLKTIDIKTIGHKKASGVFIEGDKFKEKIKAMLNLEADEVEDGEEYEFVLRDVEYTKFEKVLWGIAQLNEFSGNGFEKIKVKISELNRSPVVKEYEKVVRYRYFNYEVVDFDMDRDTLKQRLSKEIIVEPVLDQYSFKLKLVK